MARRMGMEDLFEGLYEAFLEFQKMESSEDEDDKISNRNKEIFKEIPRMLSKKLKKPKRCLSIKNPNYMIERIKFAMKQCQKKNMTSLFASHIPKSAQGAENVRKEGNAILSFNSLNALLKASASYMQSIAIAPEGSQEMTLALANQSAVLLRLEKYKECLQMIDRCLTQSLPNSTKFKLLVRKVECQKIMGDSGLAKTVSQATKMIKKQPSKSQHSMQDSLSKAQKARGVYISKDDWFEKMVQVLGLPLPNEEIPAASSSLELKYDEDKGRHFVAAKDIRPGEILILEEPYLTRSRLCSFDYCYGCLNPAYNVVPCKHCVAVIYCSEKCRQESWDTFHDVECPLVWDLEVVFGRTETDVVKNGGTAIRMTIAALREFGSVDRLRKEINDIESNPDERTKGFSADGKFHSDKYRSVYSLEKGSLNPDNTPVMAAIFVHLLATKTKIFGRQYTSWEEIIKNDDILFVADLFTKNLAISKMNNFGIRPSHENRLLMTSMNFIRHSCHANVTVTHRAGSNAVIALQTIKKGEEILMSHNFDKDQTRYVDDGVFTMGCLCDACKSNWTPIPAFPPVAELVSDDETEKLLTKEFESIQPLLDGYEKMKHSSEMSFEHFIYVLQRLFDCIATFDKYIVEPSFEIYAIRQFIAKVMKNIEKEFTVPPLH